MIIVFADDQTVAVLPNIVPVRRECEAVDAPNKLRIVVVRVFEPPQNPGLN